ncbi:hypothetical protein ACFX5D_14105 [Flavobacterium sp. LB3P45]|uniref:Uncharacterized protein n=1 Tax=Flavobacterium fructosi TaxID=3230416 RepID=A0ABW6HQ10_9FLAO
MKKLLLLTVALLALSFAQAQDLQTIDLMVQSNSLEDIKWVSDKIAVLSPEKYVYYKTGNRTLRDEKYKTIIYAPASMTDEDKKEFTQEEKDSCLIVVWSDKGNSYSFFEVSNQDKNLLPFWKITFASDKEYRVSKELKYKFVKNETSSSIVKSY